MAEHPLDAYAGCWALVTGSARREGLGFAFARELASRRINIALVDILGEELEERAAELRSSYGISVRTVATDLACLESIAELQEALQDVDVDILVCIHMYTPTDTPQILDIPLDVHNRMVDINARAYVNLIYRFGQSMRTRRKGAIVIVSSGAGLAPAPYTGAYSANKAFQIAFGEALWYELRPSGVDVVVMAAGLMNTQGDTFSKYPQWQITDRDDVAAEALRDRAETLRHARVADAHLRRSHDRTAVAAPGRDADGPLHERWTGQRQGVTRSIVAAEKTREPPGRGASPRHSW